MKRGLNFLIIALLLVSLITLNINLSQAQIIGDINQTQNFSQKISDAANNPKETSGYLANELKTMLLKNPTIADINNALMKVSVFFRIVFGESFDILHIIRLFVVIVLWFYFFGLMRRALTIFSFFSGLTSTLVAIALSVILAQAGLYRLIGGLIETFLLEFSWIWKILIVAGIIVAGKLLKMALKDFIERYKVTKEMINEEKKKEELESTLKRANVAINPYVDAVNKTDDAPPAKNDKLDTDFKGFKTKKK